jgi:isopentenyl-diphosphate delta-isomerase
MHPGGKSGRDRKAEHIRLAMEDRMQLETHFFDHLAFEHCALPEIDFRAVDVTTEFLGHKLWAPLLISCMTGGTDEATRINRNLAVAAERERVAVGVGSQRKAFEDPETAASFRIRRFAPSVPLLANLGAVQLNYGFGLDECRRAVEMIEGDALVLHLNALQEAIQPEGQCDFSGLISKIGNVARGLDAPVIVKEVGCGISARLAERLVEEDVRIVDCAGLGGTSWARIEAARAGDTEIGEAFAGWGIPTPVAIEQLRRVPGLTVIGSGGLRNGVDLAKAVALGADLGGMAFQFLEAATRSAESVAEKIRRTVQELKIAMFCVGASNLAELRQRTLLRVRSRGTE